MSISFKFAQGTLALGQSKLDCLASLGMAATVPLTRDDLSGDLPKACKGGLDANPNPSLKDKKLLFPVADYWGLRRYRLPHLRRQLLHLRGIVPRPAVHGDLQPYLTATDLARCFARSALSRSLPSQ